MNAKTNPEDQSSSAAERKPGVKYPSPFLTTAEAAAYLQISKTLLQTLRTSGEGPAFLRVSSRRVLYSIDSLEAWLKANTHQSTAEYPTTQARMTEGGRRRRGRAGMPVSESAQS